MKQLVLRGGAPQVVDVPQPAPAAGRVLVGNLASVISSGTERAAVTSGGGGGPLAVRAIRNPDLVKKALEHLRDHGLRETLDLARGLTAPDAALGYSSAGVVIDTGGIPDFRPGQLVACAGAGSANHAEIVSVPGNLVAAVPEGVEPRAAAFTTIAAIGLQGVRRAEPTLGERVVVVGLGLVGLIVLQLLRAAGCQVYGIEPVERRRELAARFGADGAMAPESAGDAVGTWTAGSGADAVLVCAAAPGREIINSAVGLLRRKGRVVAVGDVSLDIDRGPLYVREADVLISTSYGPGRYDASYEEAGVDYPLAYVRWTENRNMGEVLRLLSGGQLSVDALIESEVPLARAAEAYRALTSQEPPLATVLTYEPTSDHPRRESPIRISRESDAPRPDGVVRVALIGAGGFVMNMHVPNLQAEGGAEVTAIVNQRGTSANDALRRIGTGEALADWRAAIERADVDLVLIGTRHDTHAEIAAAALQAGKAVFLEKPLGLSRTEIDAVWEAGRSNDRLVIGFNRPFAPLAEALQRELAEGEPAPIQVLYRVSAPVAPDHWLNDPAVGGGRVLGEACHMYDFVNWLCGTPERVSAAALPAVRDVRTVESSTVTISFANGSTATVVYSAEGAPEMPKERIEVFAGGRSWVLDDFASLTSYTRGNTKTVTAQKQDKGHAALMRSVLAASRGERPFEPGLTAAYVAQSVALATLEAIATGQTVAVELPPP